LGYLNRPAEGVLSIRWMRYDGHPHNAERTPAGAAVIASSEVLHVFDQCPFIVVAGVIAVAAAFVSLRSANGSLNGSDHVSACDCHHRDRQARGDEVDTDDQPERPARSSWPSADEHRSQNQIDDPAHHHPSPGIREGIAMFDRSRDLN